MTDPRCDACTLGVFKGDSDVGECRRRPPQPMLRPVLTENKLTKLKIQSWEPVAFFPPIQRHSWCGKFVAREAAAIIRPLSAQTPAAFTA